MVARWDRRELLSAVRTWCSAVASAWRVTVAVVPRGGSGGRNLATVHAHSSQPGGAPLFRGLQGGGRFVRDTRVGGMFHRGRISLREIAPRGSLHISIGDDNRISAHVDRFSPLAASRLGGAARYSLVRVVAHNAGILADYCGLVVNRRFGQQRCEVECERVEVIVDGEAPVRLELGDDGAWTATHEA